MTETRVENVATTIVEGHAQATRRDWSQSDHDLHGRIVRILTAALASPPAPAASPAQRCAFCDAGLACRVSPAPVSPTREQIAGHVATELRDVAKSLGLMAEPLLYAGPNNGQARRRERDELIAGLRRAEGRVLDALQDIRAALAPVGAQAPPAPVSPTREQRLAEALERFAAEIKYGLAAGEPRPPGGQQVSPSAEGFTCVPSTRRRLAHIAKEAMSALAPVGEQEQP